MPIRKVPKTEYNYYLVIHDENGVERNEAGGALLSTAILEEVARQPVNDIFIMSHGWRGDVPAAIKQYDAWTGNLMTAVPDLDDMTRRRPDFRPVLIGWHWPSEPWGDESMGSFDSLADPVPALVDDYARRLGDTPEIRTDLETIIRAHATSDAPASVPPEVVAAYQRLDQRLGMGHGGEGAPPGADLPEFDPESIFQAAVEADSMSGMGSFGAFGIGDLLAPLRVLSFWKMKDRARKFGESGGHRMLTAIRKAAAGKDVRIHLMGHSFGCIVVTAAAAGPAGSPAGALVDSMVLVQGALSIWAYCANIPFAKGTAGYFNRLIAAKKVRGPIVTTQAERDSAVGTLYPLAAGLKGQLSFGDLPKYGAVGTLGIQGADAIGRNMSEPTEDYRFEPGRIYNVESSAYIRSGNPPSGAHSDIVHPEVAHLIWEAAKAGIAGFSPRLFGPELRKL